MYIRVPEVPLNNVAKNFKLRLYKNRTGLNRHLLIKLPSRREITHSKLIIAYNKTL